MKDSCKKVMCYVVISGTLAAKHKKYGRIKKSPKYTVADLGEGAGSLPPPTLFWVKKEEMTEGR